ncbi:L-rhamnose mutarotase [Erwinia pyrifoliae]|uniref:L-rhamnose mutarotase n=1 Tax=Erwinia pyrifoliae TaxID=79967 RepID=A0ABY5X9G0_ERWPY|nr:L-rhamnose mutarotase [Erwinia pyrifoliae]AUX73989.1 L-rhamnose mutarotase [Erwinia pyrifoliae]MCA8875672.1 L-rhamnose mutarotase [Erwinia pyrifoliae]MCT2385877.1 L-rhamnose mutarotase [Erwinia pyrifoliae]MCU8588546.1 L-rhamnose mutarotase [Erwinia pyrifoliae]UWS29715.1 L-rhamnose mutarotase [Erwinia pyrifoliae]
MKSWALTIELRNRKAVEIYREMHLNQIPEIHAGDGALAAIGIKTMQIFFMQPNMLFMYMETNDDFIPSREFTHALTLDPKVKAFDDYVHGELLQRVFMNDGPTEWAVMDKFYQFDSRPDPVQY